MKKHLKNQPHFLAGLFALNLLTACTPTIQLDTPKEGITINMNVVVDHNINVTMDEKAKAVSGENKKK
ncbi:YnbE family lipoprotein [Rodentibacter haemolyticus]|uniref:YnbE family lipoprotein n=1 Tax=Rodentibacter haemolyticus TaxID=2778911 RepID=A0ABX6UY97_9PAST|nr:YnbE family lipoprotein [Rodentibacter haemolyticus]QPB42449.1 YnbE family lipoprotein [Rodentibacter haemolyticus]